MNEINIKTGDIVWVSNSQQGPWYGLSFHHFHNDVIFTYEPTINIFRSWKYWKLPDPPKPEKKEYWVNWYSKHEPAVYDTLALAIECEANYILARFHVTQEEGKLPVVEVIKP